MRPFAPLDVPLRGRCLVEASAGTGKTYAITTLLVRLIAEEDLGVGDVLVVTFTEAATAELRDRVRGRLRQALAAFAGGAGADDDLQRLVARSPDRTAARARVAAALRDVDQAAVYTIHGFCHRVLRERAFESDALFDQELVHDLQGLRDQVIQDWFVQQLAAAPLPRARALAEHKVTLAACRKLVDKALRDPALRIVPPPPERVDDDTADPRAYALAFQHGLVRFARAELPRRKDALGVMSFDDLLNKVLTALQGESGAALARGVRRRWPVALVDEFQDTDPVQYEIFDRIWAPARVVDTESDTVSTSWPRLVLVGDPKQAIYAFRGADVFAYLRAARDTDAGDRWTMDTNRRSSPGLVAAVNLLFRDLPRPFLLEGIGYPVVQARPGAADEVAAPLEILFVPRTRDEDEFNKSRYGRGTIGILWRDHELPRLVAAEIAGLLRSRARIGDQEVTPGQIAVLTRINAQAAAVQNALRALRIPAVLLGDQSVFVSDEAGDLARVLAAVAEPSNTAAVRAALTTELLGVTAGELVRLEESSREWEAWANDFREAHATWGGRGFVQMLRTLMARRRVQERLLSLPGGERRMTNLLHLMELMHAASREQHLGPVALLHWLAMQRRTDRYAGEEEQQRLESDESAVRVTTVHKAKGLEYDVVYCLPLWQGRLVFGDDQRSLPFHDPAAADAPTVDIDSNRAADAAAAMCAEREAFAESLRLFYVALTRARHRCTVVYGAFPGFAHGALGYLLHPPASPDDLTVKKIGNKLRRLGDRELVERLERLAVAAGGCIAVRTVEREVGALQSPAPAEAAATEQLGCRAFARELDRSWRIASFSWLAATAAPTAPATGAADEREGRERDDLDAEPSAEPGPPAPAEPVPLASMARGTRTGNFFHELLERVDFAAAAAARAPLVDALLAAHGLAADAWRAPVQRALDDVLQTPLSLRGGDLRLAEVAAGRRRAEMEFHLPVALEGSAHVSPARLADALRAAPGQVMPEDYCDRVARLRFGALRGFLKGYIDLVFEHRGRYWVVDWKTTHLGDHFEDYAPPRLRAAMAHGHYFLQYHLYCVAVHRWLARRVRDYDYEHHFGGALYLFLRGMSPARGMASGVFFERPPLARIEALSRLLAPSEASP